MGIGGADVPVNPVLQAGLLVHAGISPGNIILWKLQDGPLSASAIFAKHWVISKPPNPFWDLQEKAASFLTAVWIQGYLEGWEEQHRNSGQC